MVLSKFQILAQKTLLHVLLVLLVMATVESATSSMAEDEDLMKMIKSNINTTAKPHQRGRNAGCWVQPWVCRQGLPKREALRRLCCRNSCVDVKSDPNNCGFCGIRCPFRWQCCDGFCINVMINPFHCGTCFNRCPFKSPCLFGLCGYAAPFPFPFPLPPLKPKPPKGPWELPPLAVIGPPAEA